MSVLDKLASALAPIAPTLATLLGGPLAGAGVAAVEGALGVTGPDACAQQLSAGLLTPDQLAALKKADLEHEEKMRALGVDLARINAAHTEAFEKIAADDRNSARVREAAVRDYTPRILAYCIVMIYAGVQAYLLTQVINEDMREIVMRALGTLDAAMTLVLSYYFGSSAGSKSKDEVVDRLTGTGSLAPVPPSASLPRSP